MSKLRTFGIGLLGIAGTEANASEIAQKATEAITDPNNIVTIGDLLVKIAVAFVTIWQILKPKKEVKLKNDE